MTNQSAMLFTVFLLLLFICLCACICPEDSTREVIQCLRNITHGHNATNVIAGTDTQTVQHYCVSGYFNKSVECLVHLYHVCSSSSEITSLQTIADPQTWRKGVNQLCENLPLHAEYSDCIVAQKSRVIECLNMNELQFQRTVNVKHSRKSIANNLCRYFKGVEVCTAMPIEVNCSKDTGLILAKFIESLSPKFCQKPTAVSVMPNNFNFWKVFNFIFYMQILSFSYTVT